MARLTTNAADWASKLGTRYQLAARLATSALAIRPMIAVRIPTKIEDDQDMSARARETSGRDDHGSPVVHSPLCHRSAASVSVGTGRSDCTNVSIVVSTVCSRSLPVMPP